VNRGGRGALTSEPARGKIHQAKPSTETPSKVSHILCDSWNALQYIILLYYIIKDCGNICVQYYKNKSIPGNL
jgi:hypothetical protein